MLGRKREGSGGGWVMRAFRCLQLIYGTKWVPLRYRTCGQRSLHGPGSDSESDVRQALRCMGGGSDAAPAAVRPAAVHGLRKATTGRYVPWQNFGKTWDYIYPPNKRVLNRCNILFPFLVLPQNMIVQLDAPEWGAISTTGKDLVMKMLSPNPKNRPTIAEILEHPWMRVSGGRMNKVSEVIGKI